MYFGIGCGLLVLIGIVMLVLGLGWGARKVGGLLSDIQANPDKFAAKVRVKSDPNHELGVPSWFPVMDGLVFGGTELHTSNGARESIHLTATSTAATDEIVAFYSDELDKLGFTIARHSQTAGALVNEQIDAVDRAGGRRATINVTRPQPDAPAGIVVAIERGAGP